MKVVRAHVAGDAVHVHVQHRVETALGELRVAGVRVDERPLDGRRFHELVLQRPPHVRRRKVQCLNEGFVAVRNFLLGIRRRSPVDGASGCDDGRGDEAEGRDQQAAFSGLAGCFERASQPGCPGRDRRLASRGALGVEVGHQRHLGAVGAADRHAADLVPGGIGDSGRLDGLLDRATSREKQHEDGGGVDSNLHLAVSLRERGRQPRIAAHADPDVRLKLAVVFLGVGNSLFYMELKFVLRPLTADAEDSAPAVMASGLAVSSPDPETSIPAVRPTTAPFPSRLMPGTRAAGSRARWAGTSRS